MAFIITPGQFSRRAEFYHQLGQLTSAGLGVVRALEQLKRHPPAASDRAPIGRLLERLGSGGTLSESVRNLGGWLPDFDIALLQAGEQSGRLETSFRLLAQYYEERARMARQMMGDLAYPAFLLHFAVFIFPFAQLFLSGNWLAKSSGKLEQSRTASAGVLPASTSGRQAATARRNAGDPLAVAASSQASTIDMPALIRASSAPASRDSASHRRPVPSTGIGCRTFSTTPRHGSPRSLWHA